MVGETTGQSFTTAQSGLVLGGVGLDFHQDFTCPVYVAGKCAGGNEASRRAIDGGPRCQGDVCIDVGRTEDKDISEAQGCAKDLVAASDKRPLPWLHLVIVMLSVASDAFALMGPLPFLPQLCVAQYGLAEADVGYYVGLFTGAYSLANFCTSWMIGHLSDEYGRKAFTLLGLFTSASLTMALGLTTSVWVGIASRLPTGALNANFALSRAQIADLVPNGARAVPYAYLGATFALARTFSSGVGGLSVGLFWADEFGVYMAPCVMLGVPAAITFILVILFLPLTHAVAGSPRALAGATA
jgi:MFS family permease